MISNRRPISDNDLEIINTAHHILTKAGNELSQEPVSTRYLRDIQKILENSSAHANDPSLAFVMFFIPLLVNDIYFNLVGDIGRTNTEIIAEVRVKVFWQLGQTFLTIANELANNNLETICPIYQDFVQFYIKQVDQLNRRTFYK